MAYTVLARKYRSRTFDEVIGQKPIATTLVNAIKTGRIHHGYLFTGTRGSGKTSMARILAKALNCLKSDAPTVKPCLECDACRSIAEGQDLDVVEIDAASNTGVDNIRELRSNTAFRPARCRFKIYIIDEVHMLSTGAFNALLKTLEEPPEHVKFILATTEIQKVPATIRSRCQTFNFRNIAPDDIAGRLASIAKEEGAQTEEVVLRRVARLANGSMRDALSILDQLLSVSPKKLTAAVLDEVLPPAQDEQVFKLLSSAAAGDVSGVLTGVDALLSGGRGLETFCNDAIEVAHTLMTLRACGPETTLVDFPAGNRDEYVKLAGRFELSQYVQMIAMLEELKRNVRFSGAGRALADAMLIRLAKLREWSSIEQLLSGLSGEAQAEKKKTRPVGDTAAAPYEPEAPVRSPVPAGGTPDGGPESGGRASGRSSPNPRTMDRTFVEPRENGTVAPLVAAPTNLSETSPRAAVATIAASETLVIPAAPPVSAPTARGKYAEATEFEPAAEADAEEGEPLAPADSPRPAVAAPPIRRPVSRDEQRRIESDPTVRQAIQLLDASIVNIEWIGLPRSAEDAAREELES